MANPWLPNAEIIGSTKSGGSYDGSPYRLVLHTVEGDPGTVDGCRALAESHGSPPQLWYHPRLRWLGQGIGLDRSGYALAHPSGTPETNKAGAIQVEMFGFAADTPYWSTELDNIGVDVVRSLLDAGWPLDVSRRAPTTGNDGYGQSGAVRGSWEQWANFTGVCVHASVPANDHWDAGDIDLDRICNAALGSPEPQPRRHDDMTPGQCRDKTGRKWFFVVGDTLEMFASIDGGEFFPIGGLWTSGLDAYCEDDGVIVVAGRDTDGALSQCIIWTDGSPEPGRPPFFERIGGHIYPGPS